MPTSVRSACPLPEVAGMPMSSAIRCTGRPSLPERPRTVNVTAVPKLRNGEVLRRGDWIRWPGADGDWTLRLTWGEVAGSRVECIGVEIWRGAQPDPTDAGCDDRPPPPWVAHPGFDEPQPITSLRNLPMAQIVRQQRAVTLRRQEMSKAATAEWPTDLAPTGLDDHIDETLEAFTNASRGRPAFPDEHYLQIARTYIENADTPRRAVMERFHLSARGASRAIERAEGLGFLSHAGRRGALRQPGPRYRWTEKSDHVQREKPDPPATTRGQANGATSSKRRRKSDGNHQAP